MAIVERCRASFSHNVFMFIFADLLCFAPVLHISVNYSKFAVFWLNMDFYILGRMDHYLLGLLFSSNTFFCRYKMFQFLFKLICFISFSFAAININQVTAWTVQFSFIMREAGGGGGRTFKYLFIILKYILINN